MFACSISNNYLTGFDGKDMTGIKAIADALHVNSSMTSLNVADNNLGGKIESDYISDESWAIGDVVEHEGFTWTCTLVDEDDDRKLTRYDMTGIKAIADALGVSTCSLNSLK